MNYEWQTPFRFAFELLAFLTGWALVAVVLFIGVAIVAGLVTGVKKGLNTLDLPKKKSEPEKVEPLLGVVSPEPKTEYQDTKALFLKDMFGND
jgi:hypothetical protein